jgi:hypothetical protein
VAIKGWKRLIASADDIERERLGKRYAHLAEVPIAQMPLRQPVRVVGEVSRHRVVPRAGAPWLEVTVTDGTGEIVAAFAGRRRVGGLDAGRSVVLEGVAHRAANGKIVVFNPAYTLLAQ